MFLAKGVMEEDEDPGVLPFAVPAPSLDFLANGVAGSPSRLFIQPEKRVN